MLLCHSHDKKEPRRLCAVYYVLLYNMSSNMSRLALRCFSSFNQPPSGNDLARSAGIASFMRLPIQKTACGLDVAILGVPFDSATSNRPGTRFGPRQIRCESVLIRAVNSHNFVGPFERVNVCDLGDVGVIPYSAARTVEATEEFLSTKVVRFGAIPITMGGDHLITYPILKALAEKNGPMAMIHVDAHSDTSDNMLGEKLAHGTPFRRANDDGLLQNGKVWQIGLRGSIYSREDYDFAKSNSWKVIRAHELFHKSLVGLMDKIRSELGSSVPTYLTFDIDAIEPGLCPGTGTPEIGGLTVIQAMEIIRGCAGLNLVGCDVVEVAPMYDTAGTTSLTAANLMFEMLCVLPKVVN